MVRQHLYEYGDDVDGLAETAGRRAIEALADFGLMEVVDTRFGRWTTLDCFSPMARRSNAQQSRSASNL